MGEVTRISTYLCLDEYILGDIFFMSKKENATQEQSKRLFTTKHLVTISLLSAIASVLMFYSIPIPFLFPDYLKIDLGDVPAVIAGITMGPLAGGFVELIKNLVNLPTTKSGGVGELANFLIGLSLILPISVLFKRKPSNKTFIVGAVISVVIMTIVGAILNYYVLLPMYGMEVGAEYIMLTTIPFNLFKGTVVMVVSGILYKYIIKNIFM